MIPIADLLERIQHIQFIGDKAGSIAIPLPLDVNNNDASVLMWVNDANLKLLDQVNTGTIICSSNFTAYKSNCNYIIVERPRLAFKEVITQFFTPVIQPSISLSAIVHPTCIIGNRVTLGHHVVVEENCTIGDNTTIGHNTIIHANTTIGNAVTIGCNNTIGGVGFGYEKDIDGEYSLIPHIGNVVIGNHVEIGNNTCIDRAVLGSTILHDNVKVDNLVHIAHGVCIGKNSLIIANAMVAGSTSIGENVWLAPSASVLNKRTIGNNAVIGMGAVVLKNVNEGETIIGNPGKPLTR
ncbi:MAG: hypothetical protein LH478_15815 [Chitinophagaceae bacterium]|nr:hypothetical protein [Chitinophagaceae bacterium]